MEIIPAIDLLDGKVVRLQRGSFEQVTIYHSNPLDWAKRLQDAGFRRLHLVDLNGAKDGKIQHFPWLEKIASHTELRVDFSGGIRSMQDAKDAFDAGATWICLGSMPIKQPQEFEAIIRLFTPLKIILVADVKDEKVHIHGWKDASEISIMEFIETFKQQGIEQFLCTDILKDGMMEGPSTELYTQILNQYSSIQLIASGGIASKDDFDALKAIGVAGAIVGKALYEGNITLDDCTRWMLNH